MNILIFALKFFHYAVCVGLIIVVILQAGKGGVITGRGIFVGGGSDQIFSAPSGVAFINKVTIFMACVFLFTSLLLAKFSMNINYESVVGSMPNMSRSASAESADN